MITWIYEISNLVMCFCISCYYEPIVCWYVDIRFTNGIVYILKNEIGDDNKWKQVTDICTIYQSKSCCTYISQHLVNSSHSSFNSITVSIVIFCGTCYSHEIISYFDNHPAQLSSSISCCRNNWYQTLFSALCYLLRSTLFLLQVISGNLLTYTGTNDTVQTETPHICAIQTLLLKQTLGNMELLVVMLHGI